MKPAARILAVALIVAVPAVASEKSERTGKSRWQGSIAVKGEHSQEELAKMAKVSEADARRDALGAVRAGEDAKTVTEAELEVENGYLVWSCSVKVKGKKGIQEILVDAGTGTVLSRETESDAQEAREAREESKEVHAAPRKPTVRSVALPGAPPSGVYMDYIAYDRAHHRVWVPAGNTGSVDVLDVAGDKVTRVEGFATSEVERNGTKRTVGPSSATVGDGVVYVGNRGDSSVCMVGAESLRLGACVKLESMPDGLAWVAATKEVWVTTPRDSSITILDASADGLTKKGRIALDGQPEGYAVDSGRGVFYTNLEDKDRTLAIDIKTRRVVKTWMPECGEDGPKGLALDGAFDFLMVACTDRVMVLDAGHNGKRLSSAVVGEGIDNIDYVVSRHDLYCAAGRAGTLTVLRLDSHGRLTPRTSVATGPGARNAVATDEGSAYVTDSREGKILIVGP